MKKYKSIGTYWTEKNPESRWDTTSVEKIEEIVQEIMIEFGPDGHCDGSYELMKFIVFLMTVNNKCIEDVLSMTDFEEIKKVIFNKDNHGQKED